MPLGVYPGLEITRVSVKDAVTSAKHQTDAVLALHERFHTPVLLTAMDLSVEAETFGSDVRIEDDEIPTVIGRLVTTDEDIEKLLIPSVGDKRASIYLQTAQKLVAQANGVHVLGGVIGPFSLAGRLFGVSELLELSLTDPKLTKRLLQKVTQFLIGYVLAFRDQGVDGVIMAEPAAGLLSPEGLAKYSSVFVKKIVDESQTDDFSIVLHNCGAKFIHFPKILEAGAEIYHFGAVMDIEKALAEIPEDVILAGNLDPTSVFHSSTPEEVEEHTKSLLNKTSHYRNFIISSGCDIPPGTPLKNLETFYNTVNLFN
jgi:uroporphyrinogen decarboxylase